MNKQASKQAGERVSGEENKINNKFIVNIVNSFIVVMDPARNISQRYFFYLFIGHSQLKKNFFCVKIIPGLEGI